MIDVGESGSACIAHIGTNDVPDTVHAWYLKVEQYDPSKLESKSCEHSRAALLAQETTSRRVILKVEAAKSLLIMAHRSTPRRGCQ